MKQKYIEQSKIDLSELVKVIKSQVYDDEYWKIELRKIQGENSKIHLAIFVEPYLSWVIEGKKFIESRFSMNRCAPFEKIKKGDIILLKRSGGPIVAIARAGSVWFYYLDPKSWKEIKATFKEGLCAQDPKFWKDRKSASYATLIKLEQVKRIDPILFPKRDRRGWVILSNDKQLEIKYSQ